VRARPAQSCWPSAGPSGTLRTQAQASEEPTTDSAKFAELPPVKLLFWKGLLAVEELPLSIRPTLQLLYV
jgi:hypothetical protein